MFKEEAINLSRNLLQEFYPQQDVEQALAVLVEGRNEREEKLLCLQTELRRKAEFDGLTGVYKRSTFYQKAGALFRQYPEEKFVILRLNVERFKLINDLFGEAVGDQLLVRIATYLNECRLDRCLCGRLHADNFVMCFPLSGNDLVQFIHDMQAAVAQAISSYKVIMDFGIYYVIDKKLPVRAMCDRAGLALQQVKGRYTKSYSEYDENMHKKIVQEQDIVNEMNQALATGQFQIYLQPKYDLLTEKIVGAEALARWIHPTKGIIPPAAFIPAFERNGFIWELDVYIWENTCRLLRKWLDEGKNPKPISVNVSRLDLYRTDLCDILSSLVKKYDLDPALLELELTESAYVEQPQKIIEVTKELQSRGFFILMDDFGSGYSSLNMLKDVSVNVLKLDLRFLDSTDESVRGNNILTCIVHMAQWLDMAVIAEGVENKQQADFLRGIGCQQVQGYYYSRPIKVEEYEALS